LFLVVKRSRLKLKPNVMLALGLHTMRVGRENSRDMNLYCATAVLHTEPRFRAAALTSDGVSVLQRSILEKSTSKTEAQPVLRPCKVKRGCWGCAPCV
jgi:hypothetical protein